MHMILFTLRRRLARRQSGQATVLALAALIFLTVMTLSVFNVQQATYSKQKVMNAADGAAYAAAATLARDMNYMAYTNRAMVANHVSVGQIVSMISLTQNLGQLSRNSATALRVIGLIPGLQALQGLATALERVDDMVDRLPPLMEPFIAFEEAILTALSSSQYLVRGLTIIDAKSNIDDVVKANDSFARWDNTSASGALSAVSSLDAFLNYSRPQSSDADLTRFRGVVNDSRDNFTKSRSWLLIFKGGTNMRENNKSWTGLDGAELVNPLPPWNRFYISWGGAEAGANTSPRYGRGSVSYGGLARRTANRAYNSRKRMGSMYQGLRPYFDLNDRAKNDNNAQSNPIVVLVRKPMGNTTDPKAQLSDAALDIRPNAADNSPIKLSLPPGRNDVVAAAASQVYYKRPDRRSEPVTDAQHLRNRHYSNGDYASLFTPYWQARLTALPAAVVTAIQALD